MAIFNSYVSLPEGKPQMICLDYIFSDRWVFELKVWRMYLEKIQLEKLNSWPVSFGASKNGTVRYLKPWSAPFHTHRLYNIVQYKHYLFIDCNIHRVDLKIVQ